MSPIDIALQEILEDKIGFGDELGFETEGKGSDESESGGKKKAKAKAAKESE
jgi:hypothetical protein